MFTVKRHSVEKLEWNRRTDGRRRLH